MICRIRRVSCDCVLGAIAVIAQRDRVAARVCCALSDTRAHAGRQERAAQGQMDGLLAKVRAEAVSCQRQSWCVVALATPPDISRFTDKQKNPMLRTQTVATLPTTASRASSSASGMRASARASVDGDRAASLGATGTTKRREPLQTHASVNDDSSRCVDLPLCYVV
jgi:hypothetical protein